MSIPDPIRVVRSGRPWWLFGDGTLLPVISGGDETAGDDGTADDDADDDESSDDDGGGDDGGLDPRVRAKIAKANSEARNLRKRLKELEPLAQRAKELEDASKSDVEKLTGERDELKSSLSKHTLEVARLRVALRKGLSETQAKRLVGDTEDELEADAESLLAEFGVGDGDDGGSGRRPSGGRPKERLRPGTRSEAEPEPDIAEIVKKIPRF